jgi:hypothetical protein
LSGCQLAKASAPIGAHVIDLISHAPANGLILEFSLDSNPDRSRGCCVMLSTAEGGSRRRLCRSCDNRTHNSRVTS